MTAMKLLANGFQLQLRRGGNVTENIELVHSTFSQYMATEEATKFLAQIQSATGATSKLASTAGDQSYPDFVEPTLSSDDQAAIASAKERDEAERLEIIKTAQQYNLPYEIDGLSEQWFIYSPIMIAEGKGGGVGQPGKRHSDVYSWGWRRGDMAWVNGTGSIPGVPGHNGILWGEGREVYLIDANTTVGVSLTHDIQAWAERYSEVRALTPRLNWSLDEYNCYATYKGYCASDSWKRINAWWYAPGRQGAGYNWIFMNPRDTSRFYCSSLLWAAYDSVGFNIIAPYSLANYGMVTPNMIRDSQALFTFKVSIK